jgi:serine/threonine protein phosphatase 1
MMFDFLDDPVNDSRWVANGGLETLNSYNIDVRWIHRKSETAEIARHFLEMLTDAQKRFLSSLVLRHEAGDYFFCHAGVRPGVKLHRQVEQDLLWIREPFLNSTSWFGRIVVHGHTPVREPEILPNRINIDTGAYITDRLTCLVLEGTTQRFLVSGSTHR